LTESLIDEIDHGDGAAWDTVRHTVAIPAGATTLTVQALAENSGVGRFLWNGPGKFIWMFCGVALEAPSRGIAGCTPGFWKNHTKLWDGCGNNDVTTYVRTYSRFNQIMGVKACQSWLPDCARLIDAVRLPGGHVWALDRHAAAALANADSNMGYPYTVAQVIAMYRDAVGATPGPETVESAKNKFEQANQLGNPFH
jgi:hypothetical protein